MLTNPLDPQQIKQTLSEELAIKHLNSEEQAEIILKFSNIILDRLTIELFGRLPKEVLPHVKTLADNNQTEALQAILNKHIKNIPYITEKVFAETLAEFEALKENLIA